LRSKQCRKLKHYDSWGNWEIECNEDQEWDDVLSQYPDTQDGLNQWAGDCKEDLEIRKEINGFYVTDFMKVSS
jgi:hypothetical protein